MSYIEVKGRQQLFRWFCSWSLWLASPPASFGQVTLDGSVGPAGPLAGPHYQIPAQLGRQAGPNLFHSFSEFSVGLGESATFTGPASVRNVLSRVTGSEPSNIDGLIRSTMPGADFYLINPKGILFGPHARIDVGGAFVASSAVRLDLDDGGSFDAAQPDRSILTAAPPSAFGFLNAAPVSVNSSHLQTKPGRDLTLVGGQVTVDNGTLEAPAGRINLLGTGNAASVSNPTERLAGSVPDNSSDLTGDVTLTGLTTLSADHGGQVRIRGGRLVMKGQNILAGVKVRAEGDADRPAVDVEVSQSVSLSKASEILSTASEHRAGGEVRIQAPSIELDGRSRILSGTVETTSGGDLILEAERLRVADDALVGAWTSGPGAGGDVLIRATQLEVDYGGKVLSGAESPGRGPGGDIRIQASSVQVTDGGEIVAYTTWYGRGGDVHVNADLIEVSGKVRGTELIYNSVIGTSAGYHGVPVNQQRGEGSGGDLVVQADTINLTDGGLLRANSGHDGLGGDLSVTAKDIYLSSTAPSSTGIRVEGRRLRSDPWDPRAYYNSTGSLTVQAQNVTIQGGAEISLLHWSSSGTAGTFNLEADRIVVAGLPNARPTIYPGYQIYTMFWDAYARDEVAGGAAHITAQEIELSNGAKIGTFYRAQNDGPHDFLASAGTGAPLTVSADRLVIDGPGSALLSFVTSTPLLTSKGGELTVQAREVRLLNGGEIASYADSTEALGLAVVPHAGTVRVESGLLFLSGYSGTIGQNDYRPSRIISQHPPRNSSNSGELWIQAREIQLSDRAEIGTDGIYTPSHPTGLNVLADIIQLRGSARIWTTGQVGYGLLIEAREELLLASGSRISAETFTADDRPVPHRIRIIAPRIVITDPGSGVFPSSRYDYLDLAARAVPDLHILTSDLRIEKGGVISSLSASSITDGGVIVIGGLEPDSFARSVRILNPGSGIFSDASEPANPVFTPEAGAISIAAGQLTITDQAAVTTTSSGRGPAGKIQLHGDAVTISKGATVATTASRSGPAATIEIRGQRVELSDHAQLSVASLSTSPNAGASGRIDIESTGDVIIRDRSGLTTEATSVAGGNIDITAGRRITLQSSQLTARAGGDGGSITLRAGPAESALIHLKRSSLLAESGSGQGGDIHIDPRYVVLDRSSLSANATVGNGGNVQIAAAHFLASDSLLSASSRLGLPGRVSVAAPALDIAGTVIPLAVTLVEGETHLPEHCARKLPGPVSSFVVLGQGGIPLAPEGWQPTYSGLAPTPTVSTSSALAPELPGSEAPTIAVQP